MAFILPGSDVSAVVRDADDEFVSDPAEQHTVGGSDCPQLLGTVTVDNESGERATARLELPEGDPVAIDIAPATADVPAGESVDIAVGFNSMATDDIDTVVDLSLEVDGRVGVFEIPLALDVLP